MSPSIFTDGITSVGGSRKDYGQSRQKQYSINAVKGVPSVDPVIVADFTSKERLSLWILLVGFLLPQSWFNGVFYNHEFAMILFVAVTAARVPTLLRRLLPLFVVLSIPLFFGHFLPIYRPDFDQRMSLTNYAKLCLFACFVYSLVQRCRSEANFTLLIRRVVLPASFTFAISALVDRYTTNTLFLRWHEFFDIDSSLTSQMRDSVDILVIDDISQRGFAGRSGDIVIWCILGFAAIIWLIHSHLIRLNTALAGIAILFLAAFSMPQRGAIIIIGVTVGIYLVTGRTMIPAGLKAMILLVTVGMLLIGNLLGVMYLENQETHIINARHGMSALSRAMDYGIVDEARYLMIQDQLDDFVDRPRLLVLGCGWDYGGGAVSKPHNTYIAVIVGGGVLSLATMIISVGRLLRRPSYQRQTCRSGAIGTGLLVGLVVDLGVNGYLFANTEYPAGLFVMSLAIAVILYRSFTTNVSMGGRQSS